MYNGQENRVFMVTYITLHKAILTTRKSEVLIALKIVWPLC
jgi:hypothetical protein